MSHFISLKEVTYRLKNTVDVFLSKRKVLTHVFPVLFYR